MMENIGDFGLPCNNYPVIDPKGHPHEDANGATSSIVVASLGVGSGNRKLGPGGVKDNGWGRAH